MEEPPRSDLPKCLTALRKFYASNIPVMLNDPLQIILHENIGYLVDDTKRDAAFEKLQTTIGLDCEGILTADHKKLTEICRLGGIHPDLRAKRIMAIAEMVSETFSGNLAAVFKLPTAQARKALKKFPSIGDPGVDKIMLLCGKQAVLALDSNGLRVITRLGYGEEQKSYSSTYKSAQAAVTQRHKLTMSQLVDAYRLLRIHGQKVCRNSAPICEKCPLTNWCNYYAAGRSKARAKRAKSEYEFYP